MKYNSYKVDFALKRNSSAIIPSAKYNELRQHAKSYCIGTGANAQHFNIVHTTAGFIDVYNLQKGGCAVWLADPFEIVGVYVDEKGDHYVDIDPGLKVIRLPMKAFLPDKLSETLFGKGIGVILDKYAITALSMHIQWILQKFEIQDAKQVIGWKNCDDTLRWYGASSAPQLLQKRLSLASEEEYISELNKLISGIPILQFVVCVAVASMLLAYLSITEKIKFTPFGISLVGRSSTGKSTALMLYSSIFSSPDDRNVFSSFYGTQNALIHILAKHQGVPIAYDEATIDGYINKRDFIYTFAEGREKLALDQQRNLRETHDWLCTAAFSSEEPLVFDDEEKLGLKARILNLEGYAYTRSHSHADEIQMFSNKNYGILGEMLSAKLIASDSKALRNDYEEIQKSLASDVKFIKCPLTDRLMKNYAVIMLAADILIGIGVNVDIKGLFEICVDNHNKISESTDVAKNVTIKLFNYIISNGNKTQGVRWEVEKNGIPLQLYIFEDTFNEIMRKCGVNVTKALIDDLIEKGYIIRQSKGRRKSNLTIDGVPGYGYKFNMTIARDAFGDITDAEFSNVKRHSYVDPASYQVIDVTNDEEAIIHGGNYKVITTERPIEGKAFLL